MITQDIFDSIIYWVVYAWNWADTIIIVQMPFATFSLLDICIGEFAGALFVYILFRLSGGRRIGGGD